MTATLQERLNYLVNYSSQLIFVSGNSLADQTQALEHTLFEQNDNTELAYLVADESFAVADYRRLLSQQLLGVSHGQFSRPLNECLSPLNHHEGPVMIAITRAEKVSNEVLQELWELVLQSRFAGNKQHLNVILFGQTQWAMQAKKWLPANNSGTPLLLSTQQTSFTPGGLQNLPVHNQALTDAVLLRSSSQLTHTIEQRPIVSMIAFWVAASLVFLSVLAGIMIWLYGDKASSLFTPLTAEPPATEKIAIETVSQWQPQQVATELPAPSPTVESAPETASSASVTVPTDDNAAAVAATVEDDPSPAIFDAVTPELSDSSQSEVIEPKPVSPYSGDGYFIQIAGLQDDSLLARFLRENNLQSNTLIYETLRYGGIWYVVLIATPYETAEEAKVAMATLPPFQNREQAFLKSKESIRKELSLVETTDTLQTQ